MLDGDELRDLVEKRLREAAIDLEAIDGSRVDDSVLERSEPPDEYGSWDSVEAAMWRLAENRDPARWAQLTPDGLWVAAEQVRPGELEGCGMAWFITAHGATFTQVLTPFRAHVVADSSSVSLDADLGERDRNGALVLYDESDAAARHASLPLEVDVVRWATSVSALVTRRSRA
jgi:hypothetical protein